MSAKARTVLGIVKTDSTFAQETVRGERLWVGKCIHCNARLVVGLDGESFGATLEHIVPRTHGGTDDAKNLALACARCNAGKGVRLDSRRRDDPKLVEVVTRLLALREARYRAPDPEPARQFSPPPPPRRRRRARNG